MKLINHLNWRYATKKFDPERKIDDEKLALLQESIRLAVSAYGLQLYKILILVNDEIREELRKASWDQSQITDASHLFVFCNYTLDHGRHVDDYVRRVIDVQGADEEDLKNYGKSIKSSIDSMSAVERKAWTEKQTYLALDNLLVACAELRIDACPMEGFDKEAYNRILGLDELGLNASVIAAVGYRSADDEAQNRMKVRKSISELFEIA